MDSAELFTRLAEKLTTVDAMHRTIKRAQRGKQLYTWALNPQHADPNSSLAADDRGFMNEYTGDMVSATALFPIMNAIDCLCATAELIEWRPKSRSSHTTSILAQCRTAIESAATTIWLLSDRDRQMRRGLSVRFTTSELNAQRSYHKSTTKRFGSDPGHVDTQPYKDFAEHVRLFNNRVTMLRRGENITPKASVRTSDGVVRFAAKWLDNHPPAHAAEGEPYGRKAFGFEDTASEFYLTSSAVMHGLKWPLDYMPSGELNLSHLIVDGVSVAVGMAECAVALFEVHAQQRTPRTQREPFYPDRLRPTIKRWARYFYEPVHPSVDPALLALPGSSKA
ncbi:hypothetical protein BJF84_15920 [Rhodococcus sp. CUA-806]|nr:hypothetical protein BJF84_15920 [Rhodococcus sp. CUA-806]